MNIRALVRRTLRCLFLSLSFCSEVMGGGYSIPLQSTKAIGEAGAVTAGVDDPSAVFYNPAAVSEIKGNQVMGDLVYINTVSRVINNNAKSVNKHDDAILPTAFANFHVPKTNLSLGIGAYSPFGLSTTYGESSFTRFAALRSELRTIYVTPTIAWGVTP